MKRLGPQGFDKIAILGSAPSSTLLAPFDDPDWAIWCTSPSVFATCGAKRSDVWFELHRWLPYKPAQLGAPGTRPWFSPEFHAFLKAYQGTVFMTEQQPDIPNCTPFPYKDLLDKYGPYFFSSSVSWMLALAIEQAPKAIGLFGIDMAAGEEWGYQRPACQHFVGLAKAMGIDVVLPPESDLMRHSTLYGIGEHNQRHVKLRERLNELEANKQVVMNRIQQDTAGLHELNGAINQIKYILELWSDDIEGDLTQAMSFSGVFVKPIATPEAVRLTPEVPAAAPKRARKSKGNGSLSLAGAPDAG